MARGRRFDPDILPPQPNLVLEKELWHRAVLRVAGIDEAGRGALAGPVAAAAVILPADPTTATTLDGVRDSKQMTARQRSFWAERIQAAAQAWGVGMASSQEIDALGIVPATRLAVERALEALGVTPDHALLDGTLAISDTIPQTTLVKGDCRSLSIAAASVLAKTARDALMAQFDREYPAYGFAVHKGYGTLNHFKALKQSGPTPQHRRTFAPLKFNEAGLKTSKGENP